MAAVDDAKTILEAVSKKTLTNQQMLNAVANMMYYDVSSNTMTNEELAEAWLGYVRTIFKEQARKGAEKMQRDANEADVVAAGDTAEADI